LVEIERTWARALDTHNAETLACILADEFEDADVEGKLNDRNAVLAKIGTSHAVRHELSELHAHVHGDFAYIRGVADAIDPQAKVTRVRFTDIYAYRDGRWQCVAGHESFVAEASH
jgi:ketosteroid isomerase-like protein